MHTLLLLILLILPWSCPAFAGVPKAAVFDFELVDTSLQGELSGSRADEHARLESASEQLRKGMSESGKFVVLDVGPVRAEARKANLQACGGCDVQFAKEVGADFAVTGVVQKVSNLILNMNVYVRDVQTGKLITAMSADFRGNTDESWSRTVSYLLRNRLLAPDYGVPK